MNKIISLFLVFVLCLSLCACGSGNETPETQATVDATETTPPVTEDTEPVQTEPEYIPVEITIDNWQDYFEFVEFPVWEENGFGEIDKFELDYEFRLKEEFYPRLDAEASNIVMEISYSYGEKPCKVDYENQTYELGERLRTETTTNITDRIRDYGDKFCCSPFGITVYDETAQEVRYYDDVEMIRIQGTIYLAAQ